MSGQQQPGKREYRMVNFRKALKEFKDIPAGREKSDELFIFTGFGGDDVFEEELKGSLEFLRDTLHKNAETILNLDNTVQLYRNYAIKAGELLTSIFGSGLTNIESVAAECSSLHGDILKCEKLINRRCIDAAVPTRLVSLHMSQINRRYKAMKDKAAAAKADAERSNEDFYSSANSSETLNDSASYDESVDSVSSSYPEEEDGFRKKKKNFASTPQNAQNELSNFHEGEEEDSQAGLLSVLSKSFSGASSIVDSNKQKKMKEREKSRGHGHHHSGGKPISNQPVDLSAKRKSPHTSDGMPPSKRGLPSQCTANQVIRLSQEEDMSFGNNHERPEMSHSSKYMEGQKNIEWSNYLSGRIWLTPHD